MLRKNTQSEKKQLSISVYKTIFMLHIRNSGDLRKLVLSLDNILKTNTAEYVNTEGDVWKYRNHFCSMGIIMCRNLKNFNEPD